MPPLSREAKLKLFAQITGFEAEANDEKPDFFAPRALVQHRERLTSQAIEVLSIYSAADAIENQLQEKGFARPTLYSILTVGMDVPAGATLLGKYGEENGAFASFPQTDIHGHPGEVYALTTETGQTMMILKGRAHPYEWSNDPYGDMVVAHPIQVLKELARRSRSIDGLNPVFVLTYATGVRQGRTMKEGDLAVVLDDFPGDKDTNPGLGPRGILDLFTGSRFQPKDGRVSDIDLARLFIEFARQHDIHLFAAAAVGTPGTTEFQGSMEARHFDPAFLAALSEGKFGELVWKLFDGDQDAALLFCMGVTAELAAFRQTFKGEQDFTVLALGLATDEVGGDQSIDIDHEQVEASAKLNGERYRDLIMAFAQSPELLALIQREDLKGKDHSIRHRLFSEE